MPLTEIQSEEQFNAAIAGATGKPILVYFTASWCGPCKAVRPVVQTLADEQPDLVVLKVDADVCRPLLARYNVRGVPTFLSLKDGEEAGRHVGVMTNSAAFCKFLGISS